MLPDRHSVQMPLKFKRESNKKREEIHFSIFKRFAVEDVLLLLSFFQVQLDPFLCEKKAGKKHKKREKQESA